MTRLLTASTKKPRVQKALNSNPRLFPPPLSFRPTCVQDPPALAGRRHQGPGSPSTSPLAAHPKLASFCRSGAGVTSGPPATAAFLPAYGFVSRSYPCRDHRAKRTILPRERSSDGDPVPYVEHSCRHWVSSCRPTFLRHRSHNPLPCRS